MILGINELGSQYAMLTDIKEEGDSHDHLLDASDYSRNLTFGYLQDFFGLYHISL